MESTTLLCRDVDSSFDWTCGESASSRDCLTMFVLCDVVSGGCCVVFTVLSTEGENLCSREDSSNAFTSFVACLSPSSQKRRVCWLSRSGIF